ncbi:MAG: wax ester/triacylglycerol synthase family O-acyltransferase [Anaerolineae bacterium]|nr:wax ester/triacylglycerol synthase family O-acyltransferase [Anaerolineae bacterium]
MTTEIFGPVDTAFFYVDSPETPMNIGALTIFEGVIPFDKFINLIDSRIHQIPFYRQRVVQAPLNLGQPTWMFDPDFHIGNHVSHIQLDPPGTEEQLRQLAGHLVSGMLDRSKPLWEITLISGLEGDRSAIFFKIHHCMVDGLAAIELFTILVDFTPEVKPLQPKPLYDPQELPTPVEMIFDAIRRDIPNKLNLLGKIQHDLNNLGAIMSDKEKRRRTFIGAATLLNDNLQPIKKLTINGPNTGQMTLAWSEFSLEDIKAIRGSCGGSVNDVMLALLGGAVEGYLQNHGGANHQKFLRALVPVSMRQENEKGEFGNRISVLPIDIPFEVKDPLERLHRVTEYTQIMKTSGLSTGLDIALTLPSFAPSITQPLVWKVAPVAFALLAHTWCTNVAGPSIPMYVLGHQMLHSYGYFPLNPSNGLASVISSYNQHISMTLIADAGIIPDVTELKRHLDDTFNALRKAARLPDPPTPKPPIEATANPAPVQADPPANPAPAAPIATAPAETKSVIADDPPAPVTPPPVEAVLATANAVIEALPVAKADPPAEPPQGADSEAPPVPAEPSTESLSTAAITLPAEDAGRIDPAPVASADPPAAIDDPEPELPLPILAALPAEDAGRVDPAPVASADPPAAVVDPEPELPLPILAALPAEDAGRVDPAPVAPADPLADSPPVDVKPDPGSTAAVMIDPPGESVAAIDPIPATNPEAAPALETLPVSQPEPTMLSGNGFKAQADPVVKPAPAGKLKLFSEEWAQAYRTAINNSKAYYNASTRWEAGSLAFVMRAAPREGFLQPVAVLLDLHKGVCRGARSTTPQEAMAAAAFVIEGDYASWMKVLTGKAQPLMMLMMGKLHLKQGSMARLLPFTQSAQELVNSAQTIS